MIAKPIHYVPPRHYHDAQIEFTILSEVCRAKDAEIDKYFEDLLSGAKSGLFALNGCFCVLQPLLVSPTFLHCSV